MSKKKCFKCGETKPLSEFYAHPQTSDGYLNKCKDCAKLDSNKQFHKNANNPDWVESERKRSREKYYRLGYKKYAIKEKLLYPEKKLATSASQRMPCKKGNQKHHWSYQEEHRKDIIELTASQHKRIHAWMVYDQERMMFRRAWNNRLIDSKKDHLECIDYILKNKY